MSPIKPGWLTFSALGLLAGASIHVGQMENRPVKIFQLPQMANDTEEQRYKIGLEISAILYSDLSKEEMLEKLKPYVQLGDSFAIKKPSLPPFFFSGASNPNKESSCYWFFCGLILKTDDNGKVCGISRNQRKLRERDYFYLDIYQ